MRISLRKCDEFGEGYNNHTAIIIILRILVGDWRDDDKLLLYIFICGCPIGASAKND
jgi:hypothetical protein